MKKLIMLILMVILLFGCNDSVDNNETALYTAFDEYLNVSCPIESYHLIMSSVPGLPLDFEVLSEQTGHTINISVSSGKLLLWTDGIIDQLNTDYSFDYKNNTIYWSPLDEEVDDHSDIIIEIKSGDQIVAKAEYQITLTDNGYILTAFVFTDK